MRVIEGVPCIQLVELEAAAADPSRPPDSTLTLACVHCQCRLIFLDYLPSRKILAARCGSCGLPAMNPIIPEGHAEGSEAPAPRLIVQ